MKKILLSIILLIYMFSVTQSTAQTYTQIQDSMYRYLDKSRIPNANLYNRVMPWVRLDQYSVRDTLDYKRVTQAWHELQLCHYNGNNLMDLTKLNDRINANMVEGRGISVGYIDYHLSYLDTNALTSGALVLGANDSLPRDGNLSISPYKTRISTKYLINRSYSNVDLQFRISTQTQTIIY